MFPPRKDPNSLQNLNLTEIEYLLEGIFRHLWEQSLKFHITRASSLITQGNKTKATYFYLGSFRTYMNNLKHYFFPRAYIILPRLTDFAVILSTLALLLTSHTEMKRILAVAVNPLQSRR